MAKILFRIRFIVYAFFLRIFPALTPELLRLFIQRIEVGERETKYSRNSSQSVRIIYRDIGTVDSAMQPDEQQPKLLPPLSEVIPCPA